jgi:type VI secretion system secreted protein Hcp
MAFDAFFYFKDSRKKIDGETNDDEMSKEGAFELRSFDFGASNVINIGSDTSGAGAGKATFNEFKIKKRTDTASCSIFHNLCTGAHFDEGIMELRRSGGSNSKSGKTFIKFHFKLILVQEMTWSGADGDDVLEEDITLQYGAIKIEYFKQSPKGDMTKAQGDKGEAKWSRVLNKAIYEVNK